MLVFGQQTDGNMPLNNIVCSDSQAPELSLFFTGVSANVFSYWHKNVSKVSKPSAEFF